jgi:hypothetical protein
LPSRKVPHEIPQIHIAQLVFDKEF